MESRKRKPQVPPTNTPTGKRAKVSTVKIENTAAESVVNTATTQDDSAITLDTLYRYLVRLEKRVDSALQALGKELRDLRRGEVMLQGAFVPPDETRMSGSGLRVVATRGVQVRKDGEEEVAEEFNEEAPPTSPRKQLTPAPKPAPTPQGSVNCALPMASTPRLEGMPRVPPRMHEVRMTSRVIGVPSPWGLAVNMTPRTKEMLHSIRTSPSPEGRRRLSFGPSEKDRSTATTSSNAIAEGAAHAMACPLPQALRESAVARRQSGRLGPIKTVMENSTLDNKLGGQTGYGKSPLSRPLIRGRVAIGREVEKFPVGGGGGKEVGDESQRMNNGRGSGDATEEENSLEENGEDYQENMNPKLNQEDFRDELGHLAELPEGKDKMAIDVGSDLGSTDREEDEGKENQASTSGFEDSDDEMDQQPTKHEKEEPEGEEVTTMGVSNCGYTTTLTPIAEEPCFSTRVPLFEVPEESPARRSPLKVLPPDTLQMRVGSTKLLSSSIVLQPGHPTRRPQELPTPVHTTIITPTAATTAAAVRMADNNKGMSQPHPPTPSSSCKTPPVFRPLECPNPSATERASMPLVSPLLSAPTHPGGDSKAAENPPAGSPSAEKYNSLDIIGVAAKLDILQHLEKLAETAAEQGLDDIMHDSKVGKLLDSDNRKQNPTTNTHHPDEQEQYRDRSPSIDSHVCSENGNFAPVHGEDDDRKAKRRSYKGACGGKETEKESENVTIQYSLFGPPPASSAPASVNNTSPLTPDSGTKENWHTVPLSDKATSSPESNSVNSGGNSDSNNYISGCVPDDKASSSSRDRSILPLLSSLNLSSSETDTPKRATPFPPSPYVELVPESPETPPVAHSTPKHRFQEGQNGGQNGSFASQNDSLQKEQNDNSGDQNESFQEYGNADFGISFDENTFVHPARASEDIESLAPSPRSASPQPTDVSENYYSTESSDEDILIDDARVLYANAESEVGFSFGTERPPKEPKVKQPEDREEQPPADHEKQPLGNHEEQLPKGNNITPAAATPVRKGRLPPVKLVKPPSDDEGEDCDGGDGDAIIFRRRYGPKILPLRPARRAPPLVIAEPDPDSSFERAVAERGEELERERNGMRRGSERGSRGRRGTTRPRESGIARPTVASAARARRT